MIMDSGMPPTTDVDFSELESQLAETMLADRHRLARQLRALKDTLRTGKPIDRNPLIVLLRQEDRTERLPSPVA